MSPEHIWNRPLVLNDPDQTGSASSGPTGIENSQQNLFSEPSRALNSDLVISAIQPQTSALLGLISKDFSQNDHPSSIIHDVQPQINVQVIRDTRRALYEQTGYVPPIVGGQPRKKAEHSPRQPDLNQWPQTGGYPPGSDEYRQFRAQELGLREDVTWGEIFAFEDKQERFLVAKELGWQEDPTLVAEARRLGMDEYPSWRNILEIVLDLNDPHIPASTQKIVEKAKAVRKSVNDTYT